MTSFKDHVGSLLDVVIPCLGEEVDYRPQAGGSFLVPAIFDRRAVQVDPDTEETVSSNLPRIGVKLSNLPYPPCQGDQVRIGKEVFKVVDTLEDGQGGASLILHRQ